MFNANEEVAPTVTFTLTLGRNVKDAPMSNETWGQFTSQADTILSSFGATLYAKAYGSGEYVGMSEACMIYVGTLSGHNARMLRRTLGRLAHKYGQEAVGFIEQCNTDTLIFALQD